MKRLVVLSILLLFCGCFGQISAQSPGKILKQASKALGGEKNLLAANSWEKSGKIIRLKDGASGNFSVKAAQPNFYNVSFDLDGFETESGYNGKSSWMRDSREGLQTLTGDESRDFQAEAVYRNSRWLDFKKRKAKITAVSPTTVKGKTANVLLLATAKGGTIKMYFDAASGLLLREEIPAGTLVKIFDYDDYRMIEGINEPFAITEKIGDEIYEIKLDTIKHNRQIAAENFNFPKVSGEPLPDISQLLKELQANEDRIEDILENYSFTQKSIARELGKDGILREKESQTFQISFYKGNQIRRLVEKNDVPLNEKEQADEDKDVQKRVAEIEKKIAKDEEKTVAQKSDGTPDENSKRISIAEVLRASNLINPRRERFRGREVVVFDFEPNPNFDYKNAKSFLKFFGKTAGVMWIDAQDKQVARLEAYLADSYKIGGGLVANLKKGASFALEQERVGDEVWLPSLADINLSVKVLLVKGINVNQVIKSYNYRKFKTEVKDSKIDEIK